MPVSYRSAITRKFGSTEAFMALRRPQGGRPFIIPNLQADEFAQEPMCGHYALFPARHPDEVRYLTGLPAVAQEGDLAYYDHAHPGSQWENCCWRFSQGQGWLNHPIDEWWDLYFNHLPQWETFYLPEEPGKIVSLLRERGEKVVRDAIGLRGLISGFKLPFPDGSVLSIQRWSKGDYSGTYQVVKFPGGPEILSYPDGNSDVVKFLLTILNGEQA